MPSSLRIVHFRLYWLEMAKRHDLYMARTDGLDESQSFTN
jgi:hypothetical protein